MSEVVNENAVVLWKRLQDLDCLTGPAAIAAALAEREAQAVQREREAARGFIDGLQTAIMRAFENHGCKDIHTLVEAEILGYVATYNDNRKG